MLFDLSLAIIMWFCGYILFGRFIVPLWIIAGKFLFYAIPAFILTYILEHWSLIWIVGHPLSGILAHYLWCRKHHINWFTCEPREKYLQLRPWASKDGIKFQAN